MADANDTRRGGHPPHTIPTVDELRRLRRRRISPEELKQLREQVAAEGPDYAISVPAGRAMQALLWTLLPQATGGMPLGAVTRTRDRKMLAQIARRAESVCEHITWTLTAIGTTQAAAAASEELPLDAASDLGWGIAFLAELQHTLDNLRADALTTIRAINDDASMDLPS